MATDPVTGQIINDDKSAESVARDRSAENANPGDEGPKVPKGAVAKKVAEVGTNQTLTGDAGPGNEDENKEQK